MRQEREERGRDKGWMEMMEERVREIDDSDRSSLKHFTRVQAKLIKTMGQRKRISRILENDGKILNLYIKLKQNVHITNPKPM